MKDKELNSKIKVSADSLILLRQKKEQPSGYFEEKSLIRALLVILPVVVFISLFLTVNLVLNKFSPARYLDAVKSNFTGFSHFVAGNGLYNGMNIMVYRSGAILFVGAALSAAGAVFQGVFRNPMASPGIIGAQSGGMLAGAVYIFFFTSDSSEAVIYSYEEFKQYAASMGLLERYAKQCFIIAGAFLTVFLVVAVAKAAGRGKLSAFSLLIVGSVFVSFIQSLISLFRYYMVLLDPTDSRISSLQLFMMGSFNEVFSVWHLLSIGSVSGVCLFLLYRLRGKINLLVFGEEEARACGIHVPLLRGVLIGLSTLMTAVTISFCGQIAFIGLMVPHIARILAGPDYRTLIPVSALLGSIIMLLLYDIAAMMNAAIYINLLTSLTGGLWFVIFMLQARRRRNAEWV